MAKRVVTVAMTIGIALLVAAGPAAALPRLSYRDANYYAKVALHRKFKSSFDYGYARKVRCWKRLGVAARQCPDTSWNIGDLSYRGWVRIWLTRKTGGGAVFWNYAMRITKTNHFCLAEGGSVSECTDTIRVD